MPIPSYSIHTQVPILEVQPVQAPLEEWAMTHRRPAAPFLRSFLGLVSGRAWVW